MLFSRAHCEIWLVQYDGPPHRQDTGHLISTGEYKGEKSWENSYLAQSPI